MLFYFTTALLLLYYCFTATLRRCGGYPSGLEKGLHQSMYLFYCFTTVYIGFTAGVIQQGFEKRFIKACFTTLLLIYCFTAAYCVGDPSGLGKALHQGIYRSSSLQYI
jgi:hypothetical protein